MISILWASLIFLVIASVIPKGYNSRFVIGRTDIFEIADGTKLGELLRIVDCVVFINGSAPQNMLEQEMHDGDNIEFVYGFCGG